jgi:hypothetical protein
MPDVSPLRLSLLRALYIFIALGLALTRWPKIVDPPADVTHMETVVLAMLGAVCLLALLGIRYPLAILPVLLFELLWKIIWVLAWGVDGQLAPDQQDTLVFSLVGIILVPPVMPWRYVVDRYLKAPGDPWSTRPTTFVPASNDTPVPANGD